MIISVWEAKIEIIPFKAAKDILLISLFIVLLGMERRASHMLGKHSITELYPQPCFIFLFIFETGLAGLKRSSCLNLLSSYNYRYVLPRPVYITNFK
jgi:hypothetical protein